jgi:hypothetical protein
LGKSDGGQVICNYLKRLDSGFRLSACDAQAGRNDGKWCFSTFYETIKIDF